MEEKKDLLKTINNISSIPTLPTVVSKITTLLQNPQTSADEIGKVITTDQALATKVLKLVNSVFYGFPGRISTITHAVVILGFSTIKNIVLTASIFAAFKKNGEDLEGFDMEKFWVHSIACGAAAQVLAKNIGSELTEECFIAGLIHDIGKVILAQYMQNSFIDAVNLAHEKETLFYEAEKILFLNTHQEIGGIITQKWNLPKELHNAVTYHHIPSPHRANFDITAIVHCSDILVRALDFGNGGDEKIPAINSDVWNYLKLSKESLPALLAEINDEVDKASIFLQM